MFGSLSITPCSQISLSISMSILTSPSPTISSPRSHIPQTPLSQLYKGTRRKETHNQHKRRKPHQPNTAPPPPRPHTSPTPSPNASKSDNSASTPCPRVPQRVHSPADSAARSCSLCRPGTPRKSSGRRRRRCRRPRTGDGRPGRGRGWRSRGSGLWGRRRWHRWRRWGCRSGWWWALWFCV